MRFTARLLLGLAVVFALLAPAIEALAGGKGGGKGGTVSVRGYFRSDGTYVQPHTRTAPDGNPYNNYSFPGNYNPNTGKITPGNPDSYLKRYFNRKPAAPVPYVPALVGPSGRSLPASRPAPALEPVTAPPGSLLPASLYPTGTAAPFGPSQRPSVTSLDALDLQEPRSLDAGR
jgi:hypothetical protein